MSTKKTEYGLTNRLQGRVEADPVKEAEPASPAENKGGGSTAPQAVVTSRVSRRQLLDLSGRLSGRDKDILLALKKHRFLLTGQVKRLFFTDGVTDQANATATTRALKKLKSYLLVTTLKRRIGGVRAGSSSLVWHLTEPGERLLSLSTPDRPRKRFEEPSSVFLEHTLAVAECAVQLNTISRGSHDIDLIKVDSEPSCWRFFETKGHSLQLKPDLFAITTYDGYEDRWFIEVDLGTESTSQVITKCRTYRDYYFTGIEQEESDMFPLVVWVVPDEKRKELLRARIREAMPSDPKMFLVITPDELEKMLRQYIERSELC